MKHPVPRRSAILFPLLILLLFPLGCVTIGKKAKTPMDPPARSAGTDTKPRDNIGGGTLLDPADAADAAARKSAREWWVRLQEPRLDDLVEEAMARNVDLQIAASRVNEARALAQQARRVLRPQLELSAGYTRLESYDGGELPDALSGLLGFGVDDWDASAELAWEVDVFGGGRHAATAADARIESVQAEQEAVRLAVAAEVASAWLALGGLLEEQEVLAGQLVTLDAQRADADARFNAGLGTELDLERAVDRLASARRAAPAIEAGIAATKEQLVVLLGGADPERFGPDRLTDVRLPKQLLMPEAGIPAALIARRPDLRRRERELAAAVADTQRAETASLPRFVLAGGPVSSAGDTADLFDSDSTVWRIAPRATWSVLSGGFHPAGVKVAASRRDQAAMAYDRSVLQAIQELEVELVRLEATVREFATLRESRTALDKAVERLESAYDAGSIDQLPLLLERERLQAVERSEVLLRTRMAQQWVRLHRALGGGW